MPQTKIVCTMGPSVSAEETMTEMIQAGMAVARLNFSHGTHESHAATIRCLRSVADRQEFPLTILQDLCGPKIRVGEIAGGGLPLQPGDPVTLTCAECSPGSTEVSLPFPSLIHATPVGATILLGDGQIQLEVERKTDSELVCQATVPGVLKSHKGVNVPGVSFPIESLTPKDLDDLAFGLEQDVDWIAQSFVRTADDVRRLRRKISAQGASTPILAKIEKHEAVENLAEILAVADGLMVARGDLGVEMPIEDVPLIQKRIIREGNAVGKPVVTATQMLESMISSPQPTRAEVTDICNAILDGTDAVMLSAETAAGAYPVESVRVMARVAERTEASLQHREIFQARSLETGSGVPDAMSEGVTEIAERLHAAAILCATTTGSSARLVSRFRPHCPIVAATTNTRTWTRLGVTWGVHPVLVPRASTFDTMIDNAIVAALRSGRVREGDLVILTAGSTIESAGSTNLIKAEIIGRREHLS